MILRVLLLNHLLLQWHNWLYGQKQCCLFRLVDTMFDLSQSATIGQGTLPAFQLMEQAELA